MDKKENIVQYDITTAKGKHTVQYYYGDQESEYYIFLDGELIIVPKKYRIPFSDLNIKQQ